MSPLVALKQYEKTFVCGSVSRDGVVDIVFHDIDDSQE